MNIHEYQGKELFRKYGIPVPQGIPAMNVLDAVKAAEQLITETGSEVVVVKAQIHAGGRGKAGGVKVVKGVQAAKEAAQPAGPTASPSSSQPPSADMTGTSEVKAEARARPSALTA